MTASNSVHDGRPATLRRTPLWVGATLFLLAYLAVSPAQSALSDRSAPLPDDPASELLAYVRANAEAVFAVAALQVVSILGLAVFLRAVLPVLRSANATAADRLRTAGLLSVAAMLVSSALMCVTALVASSSSEDTVAGLRMASFYAGGVANVALLGIFVFGTARVLAQSGAVGAVAGLLLRQRLPTDRQGAVDGLDRRRGSRPDPPVPVGPGCGFRHSAHRTPVNAGPRRPARFASAGSGTSSRSWPSW
jgi:hypothetical protein